MIETYKEYHVVVPNRARYGNDLFSVMARSASEAIELWNPGQAVLMRHVPWYGDRTAQEALGRKTVSYRNSLES